MTEPIDLNELEAHLKREIENFPLSNGYHKRCTDFLQVITCLREAKEALEKATKNLISCEKHPYCTNECETKQQLENTLANINEILKFGQWRIMNLETSIPDAWFNAYLVKSKSQALASLEGKVKI